VTEGETWRGSEGVTGEGKTETEERKPKNGERRRETEEWKTENGKRKRKKGDQQSEVGLYTVGVKLL
jgi:hypothetical protein